MHAARHKACDVCHVHEKVGSDGVRDLPHAGEIDCARIGRRSGCDHFWLHLQRVLSEGVVIDLLCRPIHSVVMNLVKFSRKVRLMAVREMSAVGEVHGQEAISGLED